MLRRFEAYGFAAHAPTTERDALARVLRHTGTFVPEVLDSAVGQNRSDVAVDLVWEHAYERPDAYARYMCHPFHICVLDRYLLPENPECITASRRELQLGLLGYEVRGAPFRAASGVRRVVAMRARADATTGEVDTFLTSLGARAGVVPGLAVSVAAPNTMGLEWFPDGWTHVWEQAFVDDDAMVASLDDEAARLAGGPMVEWVDLWYEIDARTDDSVDSVPVHPVGSGGPDGPVVMIDTVVVAETDAQRYVDAFERWYLPGARARGLVLIGCWATPGGIGEDVTVTTALAVGTWADWERARNAAVRDPALGDWLAARGSMMRSGHRRFALDAGS